MNKLTIPWCLLLLFVVGCATLTTNEQPMLEDGQVHLWSREGFPVGPEWQYLQTIKINVQGRAWNALVHPHDEIQTMVFVHKDQEPPGILLLSRVNKLQRQIIYRPLGGQKTKINGRPFREQTFGLNTQTDDPEYSQYLNLLTDLGVSLSPSYKVSILDRLPLETILIRAMELSPGQTTIELPSYGKLYPQEIQDQFFMRRVRP